MNSRSRASLFLMEQIVVIMVFAVCASVCVKILADSYLLAEHTWNRGRALRAAESAAECFKATSDAAQAAALLRGNAEASEDAVYYDRNWNVCADAGAAFVLRLTPVETATSSPEPLLCEISVKESGGAELIVFTAAARRLTG